MTNELKSSLDNEPEVYDVKVGKCKWRRQAKEEVKECQQRKEAECWVKEEAATIQRQEEVDCQVWEECQAKEEKERQDREAVIKKVTETAEKRAQEDTEKKQAEAVKKIRAAKEMAVGGNSTVGIQVMPSMRWTQFKLNAREYIGCR